MDFMAYVSVPMLRQAETALVTGDQLDNDRRLRAVREASANVWALCGKRDFLPRLDSGSYDWLYYDYVAFRGADWLQITSLIDGTGASIPLAALIMEGESRYRKATQWGPWRGAHIDLGQSSLNYNSTQYGCIQVNGVTGYHDNYGTNGAAAWTPVYKDNTLATALAPSGTVNTTQTVIPLNSDPTASFDALFQSWPLKDGVNQGAIGAGSLIQMDSEWLMVLAAVNTPGNQITVMRGVQGTTPATHGTSSTISVFQVVADVREATRIWAHYLLRKDPAGFGKVTEAKVGGQMLFFPEDIVSLLLPYKKTWTV